MPVTCFAARARLRDLAETEDRAMDVEPLLPPVAAAPDDDDGRGLDEWLPSENDGPAVAWRDRLTAEMRPTIEMLDRLRERELLD
jgi:hypothetical protein